MAAPHGKFFIQDKLTTPAPHHASFKALWDTKWAKPCEMAVYPFMFASKKDFEPIVDEMVKLDMKEPYDWDAYAAVFAPHAEKLVARAEEAEKAGEIEKASVLYLRASAVYRISRFPAPRSEKQREAWTKGKAACTKGLGMREHPTKEVLIPHKHAGPSDGAEIPAYLTLPETASTSPAPVVVIMTGLDGYRTELAVWAEGWRRVGCASLVLEIPGTGDSPADRNDPTSPDREWSSLLDWIDAQKELDSKKVVVWAFSTGGFYAIRLAHTHPDRLKGVVALGGGVHHMFDPEWLDQVNHLEYPFDLANTLCYKFGYGTDMERFKKEGRAKFSLLEDGTLDKPCCDHLLLVNGTEDEIFPIDDYYLCLQHGDPKEARFVKDTKHMGEPASFFIILKWIYKLLDIKSNPGEQMKCMITKPKAEYLE